MLSGLLEITPEGFHVSSIERDDQIVCQRIEVLGWYRVDQAVPRVSDYGHRLLTFLDDDHRLSRIDKTLNRFW